jgi:hypothetical protein
MFRTLFRRFAKNLLFRLAFFARFSDGLRKICSSVCLPPHFSQTVRGKIAPPSVCLLMFLRRFEEKLLFRRSSSSFFPTLRQPSQQSPPLGHPANVHLAPPCAGRSHHLSGARDFISQTKRSPCGARNSHAKKSPCHLTRGSFYPIDYL